MSGGALKIIDTRKSPWATAPAHPSQRLVGSKPQPRLADPCLMTIFGAKGDLATRKLLPALYTLRKAHLLPEEFAVLGVAGDLLCYEEFRRNFGESVCSHEAMETTDAACDWLTARTQYLAGDVRDPGRYVDLKNKLQELDEKWKTPGNYLFYFATPPGLFVDIVKHLSAQGLALEPNGAWRRFVIEKPFGTDLQSARSLNRDILQYLKESQVYRIDHYLGKETVQNILVFRFSNGIFEPVWNRRYVDHVQITVAETLGVEHRASFYDQTGALRDMVPSHLMQLFSLTAMEPPTSFHADAVRDEQVKVLHGAPPYSHQDVLTCAVRGQYDAGTIAGQRVPAYRSEPGVAPDSKTETFVALKYSVDNWRWAGVPFYIRTGKRMAKRISEISIHFREAPLILFRDTPVDELMPNVLIINIQPDEGISLQFGVKVPGPQLHVAPVRMDFRYVDYFGEQLSTGYDRLLYDCMIGDATLFQRADMVEAGWAMVDPVLDLWKALPPRNFPNYRAGTWGPPEAFELINKDGRRWRDE